MTVTANHQCSSCGAPIVWALTGSGKRMPVDPDPHDGGNVALTEDVSGWRPTTRAQVVGPIDVELARTAGEPLYRTHFQTCEQADEWRRS